MPAEIGQPLIELLPRLRRYALVLCRDGHLADDLVQAACERALATANGPDDSVPFDAWMFTIARNIWIDRGRRTKSEGTHDDIDDHLDAAVAPDINAELQARNELQHINAAIEQLPAEQREVLLLVCVEELSYQEAADVLGLPLGTVMSRLSRARLKLANQFRPEVAS
ncbi:RNA polymerase sigma factor [Variovorax sp. PCZ-1]|uniref:RNA polymerase sigma factor n=1 Tax=Variovorax sp. PCZ-1 TaxID=2835533 RepID=UPI001BCCE625|nr:RNA polymerase sigma factor [Variovorax sp. PCZ-1]MBS7806506.1 RNA polymerase sigma factor [Variovorax sp. PCZ-1]